MAKSRCYDQFEPSTSHHIRILNKFRLGNIADSSYTNHNGRTLDLMPFMDGDSPFVRVYSNHPAIQTVTSFINKRQPANTVTAYEVAYAIKALIYNDKYQSQHPTAKYAEAYYEKHGTTQGIPAIDRKQGLPGIALFEAAANPSMLEISRDGEPSISNINIQALSLIRAMYSDNSGAYDTLVTELNSVMAAAIEQNASELEDLAGAYGTQGVNGIVVAGHNNVIRFIDGIMTRHSDPTTLNYRILNGILSKVKESTIEIHVMRNPGDLNSNGSYNIEDRNGIPVSVIRLNADAIAKSFYDKPIDRPDNWDSVAKTLNHELFHLKTGGVISKVLIENFGTRKFDISKLSDTRTIDMRKIFIMSSGLRPALSEAYPEFADEMLSASDFVTAAVDLYVTSGEAKSIIDKVLKGELAVIQARLSGTHFINDSIEMTPAVRNAVNQLMGLMKYASESNLFTGEYAITNIHEFIATVFEPGNYNIAVRTITPEHLRYKSSTGNLFTDIVDAIKNLYSTILRSLGIVDEQTIIQTTTEILSELINANVDSTPYNQSMYTYIAGTAMLDMARMREQGLFNASDIGAPLMIQSDVSLESRRKGLSPNSIGENANITALQALQDVELEMAASDMETKRLRLERRMGSLENLNRAIIHLRRVTFENSEHAVFKHLKERNSTKSLRQAFLDIKNDASQRFGETDLIGVDYTNVTDPDIIDYEYGFQDYVEIQMMEPEFERDIFSLVIPGDISSTDAEDVVANSIIKLDNVSPNRLMKAEFMAIISTIPVYRHEVEIINGATKIKRIAGAPPINMNVEAFDKLMLQVFSTFDFDMLNSQEDNIWAAIHSHLVKHLEKGLTRVGEGTAIMDDVINDSDIIISFLGFFFMINRNVNEYNSINNPQNRRIEYIDVEKVRRYGGGPDVRDYAISMGEMHVNNGVFVEMMAPEGTTDPLGWLINTTDGQKLMAQMRGVSKLGNAFISFYQSKENEKTSSLLFSNENDVTTMTVVPRYAQSISVLENKYKEGMMALMPNGVLSEKLENLKNSYNLGPNDPMLTDYRVDDKNDTRKITDKSGITILYYDTKESIPQWKFVDSMSTVNKQRHALNVLRYFGISFDSRHSSYIINNIFRTDKQTVLNESQLSNFLGNLFAMAIHYGEGPYIKPYTEILDNYFRNTEAGNLIEAVDRHDYVSEVESGTLEEYNGKYVPSSFDVILKRLASIEDAYMSSLTSNWAILNGEKVYLHGYSTNYFDQLRPHNGINGAAPKLTMRYMNRFETIPSREQLDRNPNVIWRGKPALIDSFLSGKYYRIENLEYEGSFESQFEGKDTTKMIMKDILHVIYGTSLNKVKRNGKTKRFQYVTHFGDSKRLGLVEVGVTGPKQWIYNITPTKDGLYAEVNEDYLARLFHEKMEYRMNALNISLERWYEFAKILGIKDAISIYENPQNQQNGDWMLRNEVPMVVRSAKDAFKAIESFLTVIESFLKNTEGVFTDEVDSDGNILGRDINPIVEQALVRSGMVANVDYILDRNGIVLGNATLVNDEMLHRRRTGHNDFNGIQSLTEWIEIAYTDSNGILNDSILVSDTAKQFVYDTTKYLYDRNRNTVIENEVTMPSWMNKIEEFGSFFYNQDKSKRNPVLYGTVMMNWIVGEALFNNVLGGIYQYGDGNEAGKRSKTGGSKGQRAATRPEKLSDYSRANRQYMTFLAPQSRSVILKDKKIASNALRVLFGASQTIKATDGTKYGSMLDHFMFSEAMGDSFGMVRKSDRTVKDVYSDMDITTGNGQYVRDSIIVINEDIEDNNPEAFDNIMYYFLNGRQVHQLVNYRGNDGTVYEYDGNLYNIYRAYRQAGLNLSDSIEQLQRYIYAVRATTGIDLMDNTVSFIEYESDVKQPESNMSKLGPEQFYSIIATSRAAGTPIDIPFVNRRNIARKIQQTASPEQSTKYTHFGSQQIAGTSIDIDRGRVERIQEAVTTLQDKNAVSVRSQSRGGKFDSYMRKISLYAHDNRTDASAVRGLLLNPKIAIELPFMKGVTVPNYISKMSSGNRIMVRGANLVQQSSDGLMQVYDVVVDGVQKTLNRSQIDKYIRRGKTVEMSGPRDLHHYRFLDKNNVLVESILEAQGYDVSKVKKDVAFAYKRLRDARKASEPDQAEIDALRQQYADAREKARTMTAFVKDQIATILPAEALMPFLLSQELLGYDTINDARKELGKLDLDEMFTIRYVKDGELKELDVRSFLKQKSQELKVNYYTDIEPQLEALKTFMSKEEVFETMTDDTFISKINKDFNSLGDVVQWFKTLQKATIVMGTRIPTSTWGLSHLYEVVNWTNDSGPSIWTSSIKSIFDGSDYDIDKLVVKMWSPDINGIIHYAGDTPTSELSKDQLSNLMMDLQVKAYQDPRNLDLMLTTMDMDNTLRYAEARRGENVELIGDISQTAKTFEGSMQGDVNIGRFASSLGAYLRLMSMPRIDALRSAHFLVDTKYQYTDEEIRERIVAVVSVMSELLQLSLDNAKHLVLRLLNINDVSSSIMVGLVTSKASTTRQKDFDVTDIEAFKDYLYEFFAQKPIADIIRKVHNSKAVGTFTKNLIEEIDSAIDAAAIALDNATDNAYKAYRSERTYIEQRIKDLAQIKVNVYSGKMNVAMALEAIQTEIAGTNTLEEVVAEVYSEQEKQYLGIIRGIIRKKRIETDEKLYGALSDAISELEKKLADLKSKEGIDPNTPNDNYIAEYVERRALKRSALDDLYTYTMRGNAIATFSKFLHHNGYDPHEYDLRKTIYDIELYLSGIPIEEYISLPDQNTRPDWKEHYFNRGGRYITRRRAFKESTQLRVDNYAMKSVEYIVQGLKAKHGDRFNPNAITILVPASNGIPEAMAKAFSVAGFNVTVVHPFDMKYRSESSLFIGNYSDKTADGKPMSQSRYDGYAINFVDTGNKRLDSQTRNILQTEGLSGVININTTSNTSRTSSYISSRANIGKKYANIKMGNVKPDNKQDAAQQEMLDVFLNAFGEDMTIAVFGDDLYDMNRSSETPYERALRHHADMTKELRFNKVIRHNSMLMSQMKTLVHIKQDLLTKYHEGTALYKEVETEFFRKAAIPFYTSQPQYIRFNQAYWAALMDEYIRQDDNAKHVALQGLSFGPEASNMGIPQHLDLDLRNEHNSQYFKDIFYEYVERLKENEKYKNNAFIQNLMITASHNVQMLGESGLTPMEIERRRKAFNDLAISNDPEDRMHAKAFRYYTYLHNGLNYSLVSLNGYMDDSYLESFSSFIRKVQDGANGKIKDKIVSQVLNDMRENLVDNTIVTHGVGLLKALSQEQKDYIGTTELPSAIRRYTLVSDENNNILFRNATILKKKNEVGNDDQIDSAYPYEVQSAALRNMHRLPIRVKVETELETVRPNTAKAAHNAMTGHTFTNVYSHNTGYRAGDKKLVYGRVFKVLGKPNKGRVTFVAVKNQSKKSLAGAVMARGKVDEFINKVKASFPNVKVKVVTDQTTLVPHSAGFILNGVVYYNSDQFNSDTPIHELLHPILVHGMSADSPFNAVSKILLDAARSEAQAQTEIAKTVRMLYPELSEGDYLFELASTLGGIASGDLIMDRTVAYIPTREDQTRIKRFFGRLWDSIVRFIKNVFGASYGVYDERAALYSIQEDATLKDVVNALVSDIKNGYANQYENEVLTGIQMLDEIVESRQSDLYKDGIKKLSNLDDLLLVGVGNASIKSYADEKTRNAIVSELMSNNGKYSYGGSSWDFSKQIANMASDDAIRAFYAKQVSERIMPRINDNRNEFNQKFIDFLKKIGSSTKMNTLRQVMSSDLLMETFGTQVDGKKVLMYSRQLIEALLSTVDLNSKFKIYKYSEIGLLGETDTIKSIYNPDFDVDGMFVMVYESKTINNKLTHDIALFHLGDTPIDLAGKMYTGKLITSNFYNDKEAKHKTRMTATYGNAVGAQMVIAAMKMKANKTSDVHIRRLMTFRPLVNNAEVKEFDVADMLPVIEYLSQNTEFMALLPKSIKDVLEDKTLYSPSLYEMNWGFMLRNVIENSIFGTNPMNSMTLKAIDRYLAGEMSNEAILTYIQKYNDYLIFTKRYEQDEQEDINWDKAAENPEFRALNHFAAHLRYRCKLDSKKFVSNISVLRTTAYRLPTNIINNTWKLMNEEQTKMDGLLLQRRKPVFDALESYMKRYGYKNWSAAYFLQNRGSAMFDRLFKPKQEDVDGVKYDRLELHWNKNDVETKAALNSTDKNIRITEEDLVLTNLLLDEIERSYLNLIKTQLRNDPQNIERYYSEKDGELVADEVEIEKDAKAIIKTGYIRGMVPAIMKSGGEELYEGRVGKSLKRIYETAKNDNEIFEEVMYLTSTTKSERRWPSMFLAQVMHSDDVTVGGGRRESMMGLQTVNYGTDKRSDIKVRVSNPDQNAKMSHNLFKIMNFLIADDVSKQGYEENVMPLFDMAHVMASTIALMSNDKTSQEAVHMWLEETMQSQVLHKRSKKYLAPLKVSREMDEKISAVMNGYLGITTVGGVGLSIPVAIASMVGNMTETLLHTVANTLFGNPYQMPTVADWTRAVLEYVQNHKKVLAVADKYLVVELSAIDITKNPRNLPYVTHVTTERSVHFMNRLTDNYHRHVAMVAQMVHDGTWDAHDNDGNYDANKDSRFYHVDTVEMATWKRYKSNSRIKGAKEKELMDWIALDLSKDPRYNQDPSKQPVAAYTAEDQIRLRQFADEFVIGAMSREVAPMGKNRLFFNMIMQFKNFLLSKFDSRLGGKSETSVGALRQIKENPDGTYSREWVPLLKEGTWVTAGKFLAQHTPGLNQLLLSWNVIDEIKDFKDIQNMDPMTRYNIGRAALDVIFISMALIALAAADWDEDDKKKKKDLARYHRLTRAVRNGALTSLQVAPWELLDNLTTVAAVGQAKRMMSLVTLQDPLKNLSYVAPGGGTYRVIEDYAINQD